MLEQKLKILKNVFGSFVKQGTNEYYFRCPYCNHQKKKKLAINLLKNSSITFVSGLYGTEYNNSLLLFSIIFLIYELQHYPLLPNNFYILYV
jgi:hypothetical protein